MLKGSEKQVKWANDILAKLNESVDIIKEALNRVEIPGEKHKRFYNEKVNNMINTINSYEQAKDIIEEYRYIPNKKRDRLFSLAERFELPFALLQEAEKVLEEKEVH